LEKYISDVGKGNKEYILMINKSDFLSPQLVEHWNSYFNERKIKHFFFSALIEQDKLDLEDV
jgi:ribosome biogenesis GTPase A